MPEYAEATACHQIDCVGRLTPAKQRRAAGQNEQLQLTLDRKDYEPGQEIEVSIRAPYVGAGLITIERDKVYAHAWFKTDKTASVQ